MAIAQVRAKINNTWYTLALGSNGLYSKSITAPGRTSYNMTGGYYPVTIEATNDVGTVVTADASDAALGTYLRLVVRERIPPVITLTSPAADAYLSTNQPTITFTVTDETNGSGVKSSSITIKVDGKTLSGVTKTSVTNGYSCSVKPSALADGVHTITITASDNDGNAASTVTSSFTVDTAPPSLNVTSPAKDMATNNPALTVAGTTNDAAGSPVTLSITLRGTSLGSVAVNSDGSFSKAVTLVEGENVIVVTSTDRIGRSTTVTRTVILDTSKPKIKAVSVTPNPADAGATVIVAAEVE